VIKLVYLLAGNKKSHVEKNIVSIYSFAFIG